MSALLFSNRFEQLRLQPAPTEPDVKPRWTQKHVKRENKNASSPADQIIRDAGLRMRLATKEDQPVMLEFLRKHFFLDEPLNVAIELLSSGNGTRCDGLEKFCTKSLSDNVSVVCESVDGSVDGAAAVIICGVTKREEEEGFAEKFKSFLPFDPLPPTASPEERFERIEMLLDKSVAEADCFGRHPNIDRLLDVKILSVHPHYRGRRVATALLDKARELAAEREIELIRCICSSHYTALAVSKLGYERVHRLPYCKLLDSEGKPIFDPAPPHDEITTYVLPISKSKS